MTDVTGPRELLDARGVADAFEILCGRMAVDLRDAGPLFLAGIPSGGVAVAGRLAGMLAERGVGCSLGSVDVSMHRDDLGLRDGVSVVHGTELPSDPENWTIVLVDDVQHTGRTARAAIEAVLAFGRPRRIVLAVLVDRGGRELPVRPDFTGIELKAPADVRVRVRLGEGEGVCAA